MSEQTRILALSQLQDIADKTDEIMADGIDPGDLNARLYRVGQAIQQLTGVLEVMLERA